MKATSYVLPATLVLTVTWLAGQRLSLAKLEQGNALLSSRLTGGIGAGTSSARPVSTKTALDKQPIDWSEVARELGGYEGAGDTVYLTTKLRLHDGFLAMSREELIAALDEVAAVSLGKQQREVLEARLYKSLLKKDPEAAMDRALARGFFKRTELLGTWAAQDWKGAVAWLDAQVTAGKLEGESLDGGRDLRPGFEQQLVRPLLASDENAAGRRLAALPEEKRIEILEEESWRVKTENQAALARLLREQLSDEHRLAMLNWMIVWGNSSISLAGMHDFLQRIEATPEERSACIMAMAKSGSFLRRVEPVPDPDSRMGQAVRKEASSGDLDALRSWLGKEAPELVEQASAGTLHLLLSNMPYEDVVALALHCHEAGASDEVLMAVLGPQYAGGHLELARSLAAKLSDPAKRGEVMKNLDRFRK